MIVVEINLSVYIKLIFNTKIAHLFWNVWHVIYNL